MAKCADCGMLAGISLKDQSFIEVRKQFRETGIQHTDGNLQAFARCQCAAMVCDMLKEAKDAGYGEQLRVIHTDRGNCPGFVGWIPGYSPKEHREMQQKNGYWIGS